ETFCFARKRGRASVRTLRTVTTLAETACVTHRARRERLVLSSMLLICTGRSDAQVTARLDRIGRKASDLSHRALVGTPARIVDRMGAFASAGAERIYLKILDPTDFALFDLIAEAVLLPVR